MSTRTPLVHDVYAAISQADMTALVDRCLTPTVRWHEPGRNFLSGEYEGGDEVVWDFVARLVELSCGSFRLDVRLVLTNADTVASVARATATRHGRSLSTEDLYVFRIRADRIDESWVYHPDQDAWDAFWS